MAKTRLNQSHRDYLHKLANETVERLLSRLAAKRDAALAALQEAALAVFHREYPEADMEVLRKYDKGHTGNDINVVAIDSMDRAYLQIGLPADIHKPDYGTRIPVKRALIERYTKLRDDHAKQTADRLRPYKNLIRSAVYFEDVQDAWPVAREISLPGRECRALLTLTKSDLDAIEADSAQLRRLPEADIVAVETA
ncbi:MAG: hypothetical protein ABFD89_15265 [Bryobacteraceae bacterium]